MKTAEAFTIMCMYMRMCRPARIDLLGQRFPGVCACLTSLRCKPDWQGSVPAAKLLKRMSYTIPARSCERRCRKCAQHHSCITK